MMSSSASFGSLIRRFKDSGGFEALVGALGIGSTLLSVQDSGRSIAAFCLALLACALLVSGGFRDAAGYRNRIAPLDAFSAPRIVVVVAGGLLLDTATGWVLASLLMLSLLIEIATYRVLVSAVPLAERLPGISVRNRSILPAGVAYFASLASTALLVLGGYGRGFLTAGFLLAGGTVCLLIFLLCDGIARIAQRRRGEAGLRAALIAYAPEFLVHWDAHRGTGYQLEMWLPELEKLGSDFVVVVRNVSSFPEVARLTTRPVLLRKTHAHLDSVIVPTLKAAFYVNNAIRNAHMVRFTELWHVQLNHGESDKAPSYNQTLRGYDRNFVAGQAAVDRFAQHGIETWPDYLQVIGRPQSSAVDSAHAGALQTRRRVLYAPTWAGFQADSAYSSLPFGVTIVRELLARDCDVIFRPHPYTDRDPSLRQRAREIQQLLESDTASSDHRHLWGRAAEVDMSLSECFNESDALISDVSSVVPEYLASGKPFAIAVMLGTLEEFGSRYPLSEGGYPFICAEHSLANALDGLLDEHDSRAGDRERLKNYYLGRAGDSTAFISAASMLLKQPKTGILSQSSGAAE